jgi:hypothetical protein
VKIYRKLVVDIQTGEKLFEDSYEYSGTLLVKLCGGPSQQQKDIAQQQELFQSTLMASYNQQFANQSAVLSSLDASLKPIVAAGPNQTGMSAGELANLNTTAIDTAGAAYGNAARAVNGQLAGRNNGGSANVSSGVDSQIRAELASKGAGATANAELGIQNENYALGNQNYWSAVGGTEALAGQYNPTGYAGVANTAGSNAFSSATTVQNMKNAEMASLFGGITSLAGTAVPGLSAGISAIAPNADTSILDSIG